MGGRRRRRPSSTTPGWPRRVWAYTRPYRGAVALSAALFPLLAAVDLVQPYLVKVAIDDHILQGDWPGLSRIVVLFSATLAVQYALRYAQIYLATWTGQRVVHDLRAALFAHVQRLPAAFFDRNPVGRVMTRILGDVEAIGEVFTAGRGRHPGRRHHPRRRGRRDAAPALPPHR